MSRKAGQTVFFNTVSRARRTKVQDAMGRVVAVAAVGCIYLTVTWGRYNAWSTIIGLILVSILLTVPVRTKMSWPERSTYSMAWALALLLAVGRGLEVFLAPRGLVPPRTVFVIWAILAAAAFGVTGWLARSDGS
jgi:hypothetical protein